jgi:PST family polysaccharide transporter
MIQVAVLFLRSVLLARWLPVEVFGIYALAGSVVGLTSEIPRFGMGPAFLHRAAETEDEQHAAGIHFTLKTLLTLAWAAILVAVAFLLTSGETRIALLTLTFTSTGIELAQTPRLILTRRVVHRRLALIQLATVLLATLLALSLAWKGIALWALLATDIATLVVTIVALYVWRPVWRPRLAWSRPTVRYFLRFGSRTFLATALLQALDKVDDLWTGVFLGEAALGYYSRAYTFATYPRRILAMPVNMVVGGTYAELKGDRLRLSQAFFRVNAFLVRSGFFLAGLLALVAPEFIRLALGAKWLPMLDAFRLMLVYTMLDPIKITVASAITVSGSPEKVMRARAVQLVVMLVGLMVLGPRFGISGVALAVDGMLVVGMGILFWQVRAYVDFSLRRLFGVPGLALGLGLVAAGALATIPGMQGSDWRTGTVKVVTFSTVFIGVTLLLERKEIPQMLSLFDQFLPTRDQRTLT